MKTLLVGALTLVTALSVSAGSACCPMSGKKETAKTNTTQAAKAVATTEAAMEKVSKETLSVNAEKPECAKADCPPGDCDKAMKADKKTAATATDAAHVSTSELKDLIKSEKTVVILDARSSKYDDGERIPGAKLVGPSPSAEDLAGMIPAKDSVVVTYCGSLKCPLSNKLATKLKGLGYTNVHEYKPGIAGWVEEGNKTQKLALK